MEAVGNRDIVVIGASLGGLAALSELVGGLPRDLAAAVLVVLHMADEGPALLSEILSRRGPLPAVTAEDAMQLRRGSIFVAPPGRHMLLAEDRIRVVFGPRENRCRPAIDPLFRTAAVHYRSRVIGVVLTGLLSDGAAGLLAVQGCGGVPLAQAPEDAAHPDMPLHALAAVRDAEAVPLGDLAGRLAGLTQTQAGQPPPVPDTLRIEVELTERAMRNDDWSEVPGRSTDFTCPECSGALREIDEAGIKRYRCRVGHAYDLGALVAAKDDAVDDALWLAMQTLQERAQMLAALARDDEERGRSLAARGFQERAREAHRGAETLHRLMMRLSGEAA